MQSQGQPMQPMQPQQPMSAGQVRKLGAFVWVCVGGGWECVAVLPESLEDDTQLVSPPRKIHTGFVRRVLRRVCKAVANC